MSTAIPPATNRAIAGIIRIESSLLLKATSLPMDLQVPALAQVHLSPPNPGNPRTYLQICDKYSDPTSCQHSHWWNHQERGFLATKGSLPPEGPVSTNTATDPPPPSHPRAYLHICDKYSNPTSRQHSHSRDYQDRGFLATEGYHQKSWYFKYTAITNIKRKKKFQYLWTRRCLHIFMICDSNWWVTM